MDCTSKQQAVDKQEGICKVGSCRCRTSFAISFNSLIEHKQTQHARSKCTQMMLAFACWLPGFMSSAARGGRRDFGGGQQQRAEAAAEAAGGAAAAAAAAAAMAAEAIRSSQASVSLSTICGPHPCVRQAAAAARNHFSNASYMTPYYQRLLFTVQTNPPCVCMCLQ